MSVKSGLRSADGFSWRSWAITLPLCAVGFNHAALTRVSGRRGRRDRQALSSRPFRGQVTSSRPTPLDKGKLTGAELKREGLQLQPADPLWLLVRQMRPEQDQGSGDGGLAAASGTGDRLWTLVSAGLQAGCRLAAPL